MTFDEILEQVITLLKRQGRVSYRALRGYPETLLGKKADFLDS